MGDLSLLQALKTVRTVSFMFSHINGLEYADIMINSALMGPSMQDAGNGLSGLGDDPAFSVGGNQDSSELKPFCIRNQADRCGIGDIVVRAVVINAGTKQPAGYKTRRLQKAFILHSQYDSSNF
ncbi:hypothetical protein Anapl_12117 [Anas platyrhynchos]|uniref:Uncharacterized protein n=1 Tax=Anas platyrhynchos TaxID=8839 RepID=R0LCM0_ANAPL|nr:hypothetical protein Anapl_12117 [Anas platyrhynchos]